MGRNPWTNLRLFSCAYSNKRWQSSRPIKGWQSPIPHDRQNTERSQGLAKERQPLISRAQTEKQSRYLWSSVILLLLDLLISERDLVRTIPSANHAKARFQTTDNGKRRLCPFPNAGRTVKAQQVVAKQWCGLRSRKSHMEYSPWVKDTFFKDSFHLINLLTFTSNYLTVVLVYTCD